MKLAGMIPIVLIFRLLEQLPIPTSFDILDLTWNEIVLWAALMKLWTISYLVTNKIYKSGRF